MDFTVSAYRQDKPYRQDRPYLPYSVQQVNCTAATHNITHSPCTCINSNMHIAFRNPLHTTNKHTKHIYVSGGKMPQDVGMV